MTNLLIAWILSSPFATLILMIFFGVTKLKKGENGTKSAALVTAIISLCLWWGIYFLIK